jgi:site-specific DNA recombinase
MKNTAVIYARFSSSRQREESIEGQVRECKVYAERQGLQVVKVYADRAISGRTDERPEFQQMIDDSARKQFSRVIVYTFDRFARDSYASAVYKHQLKRNGVRVLSAKENVDDSPAGVLMERVFEGFAEYYSLELAQKVKRGLKENALKGCWGSGPVPFGYVRDENRRLIYHETNIVFLKKMFEMAAAGEQYQTIIEYLNAHGAKTVMGKPFGKSSLRGPLSNPIAIGIFRWDDVTITDYIKPIISKELFDAVQRRIQRSPRKGVVNVRKSEMYLLTPRIICGECGSPMQGMSGKSSNGNLYYYYVCANKRNNASSCDIPPLPKEELEDAIYEYAVSIIKDSKNVCLIADELMDLLKSEEDVELTAMEKNLKQAKAERDKGIDAVLQGLNSPALTARIKQLDTTIENLEKEVAIAKAEKCPFEITREHIVFFLSRIAKQSKEKVLSALVRDVIVNKKDCNGNYPITVRLNYTETPALSAHTEMYASVRENSKVVNNLRIYANFFTFSFLFNYTPRRRKAKA